MVIKLLLVFSDEKKFDEFEYPLDTAQEKLRNLAYTLTSFEGVCFLLEHFLPLKAVVFPF